ncbi:hypothetical protein MRY82_06410 [bacterium]|nr:hypothetical protein [bacterium]
MYETLKNKFDIISFYSNTELFYSYTVKISLILACVSTVAFFCLVAVRFFHDRAKQKALARCKTIEKVLQIYLMKGLKNPKSQLLQSKKDYFYLAQVGEHFLQNFKGEQRQKILQLFEAIGLYQWCCKQHKNSNIEQSQVALELLSNWKNEKVFAILCQSMQHAKPQIYFIAMKALAKFNSFKAFEQVLATLIKKKVPYLMASHVLKDFAKDFSDQIVQFIQNQESKRNMKIAAMIAVEDVIDSDRLLELGLAYYNNSDKYIRAKAFHMLALSKKKLRKDVLYFGAQDNYVHVRQLVADCAYVSMPEATDVFYILLQDDNWLVSNKAIQNIIQMGSAGKILLEKVSQSSSLSGQRAKAFLMVSEV